MEDRIFCFNVDFQKAVTKINCNSFLKDLMLIAILCKIDEKALLNIVYLFLLG